MKRTLSIAFGAALLLGAHPGSALACAACYGQSDSPMAEGMNWGIFSLMGFVALVLGTVSSFFVFLAKRSSAVTDEQKSVENRENHSENKHGTV